MEGNSTLRRRHNPNGASTSNEEESKPRARRALVSMKSTLSVLVAVVVVSSAYHMLARNNTLSVTVDPDSAVSIIRPNNRKIEVKAPPLAPPKHFDCAIFWLRMPKTASTTIAQTFIRPLFREGNFTNVELGPNSCITHVGGCAPFWKSKMAGNNNLSGDKRLELWRGGPGRKGGGAVGARAGARAVTKRRWGGQVRDFGKVRRLSEELNHHDYVPPFGRKVPMSDQQSNTNQRCFPSKENEALGRSTMCHEYDATTKTMNFGMRPQMNKKAKKLPSVVQAQFNAGPRITTHVGIDPSLFGWVLPESPMVFSTFRDPLERIFSSFHFGIQFGGGRPGAVGKCNLPGINKGSFQDRVKIWEKKVVKAREILTFQNNTAPYQDLLRQYLKTCECAVDNAYVQFLDPDTKNVDVAIQNLEDYVIVGLQNDMGETLSRWVNITRRSCSNHDQFSKMEKVFSDIFDGMTADGEVKKFRESKITLDGSAESKPKEDKRRLSVARDVIILDSVKEDTEDEDEEPSPNVHLASLDFNSLDEDLKELITKFTAGDEKVWKRVVELYDMQREWGRQ